MNTDAANTLSDDELDARLRTAFATVMPLLDPPSTASPSSPIGGDAESDNERILFDLAAAHSSPQTRWKIGILGAAAATALVVAGLAVTQRTPAETPAASQPSEVSAPPAERPPDSTSIDVEIAAPVGSYPPLSCDEGDQGPCNPFAELPVADGVSDYYVGPERLGTPVVSLNEFGRLVRCTSLDATGSTCERVEGFAGVGITRYPGNVTVDTSGVETASAHDVEIGTTFADIAPLDYAKEWGNHPELGDVTIEDVVVRGQPAVAYFYAAARYVVWTERPGVLVWVKASNDAPDDLLAIAESVRRVPGPETIPWVVSVPDEKHGDVYDAGSNDADTLLVGKEIDGSECVGYRYIESACTGAITEQTFVKVVGDRALVTGIAPPTITAVRISQNGSQLVETPTRPIDASTNLLFSDFIDREGPVTVEWIDPSGVVASTEVDVDLCRDACG